MKKANVVDIDTAVWAVVIIAILALIYGVVNDTIVTEFSNSTMIPDQAKDIQSEAHTIVYKAYDAAFILILIGFLIFSIIMAKNIPVSTESSVLALIVVIFVWGFSVVAGYLYVQIATNSMIASFAAKLTYIPAIAPNMLYYALIYTFAVFVALYSK